MARLDGLPIRQSLFACPNDELAQQPVVSLRRVVRLSALVAEVLQKIFDEILHGTFRRSFTTTLFPSTARKPPDISLSFWQRPRAAASARVGFCSSPAFRGNRGRIACRNSAGFRRARIDLRARSVRNPA